MIFLVAFSLLSALAKAARGQVTSVESLAICGDPWGSNYTTRYDPFIGDQDLGQPGIYLQTQYTDGQAHWFMVYQNSADLKPYKALKVAPNTTVFLDLLSACPNFNGRIVRGSEFNLDGNVHNLATWAEINWNEYPRAFGDVSVIEGNDGPIVFAPEDGESPAVGFTHDIISGAPEQCKIRKASGAIALKPTDKNGYDQATRAYTTQRLDPQRVSIDQTHIAAVSSRTGRVKIIFYQGQH